MEINSNSNFIYNPEFLNQSKNIYSNYSNTDSKGKRYKLLQEKINDLQSMKYNDPNATTSLEYNINKLNNNTKNSILNYSEKAKYLEKTLESLISLNLSRKQIQESNRKKIEKEFEAALLDMKNKIENHKVFMMERIDNEFINIKNKLISVIENKKSINNEIYQQIKKLKNITQNEIPRLYEESNDLNYKNKENIEYLKNILNEEVNYTKNLIADNSLKIKSNEDQFNEELKNQLEIINNSMNEIKKSRKKYENEMLSQLNDFVLKIKAAVK